MTDERKEREIEGEIEGEIEREIDRGRDRERDRERDRQAGEKREVKCLFIPSFFRFHSHTHSETALSVV